MAVIREAGNIFLTNLRILATFFRFPLCGPAMNLANRIDVDFSERYRRLPTRLLALVEEK